MFLNSIFAGSCTHAEGQPVIAVTAAAPAVTAAATVSFTLSYSNLGPGPGLGIQLADTLPANASFVSATGGGTFSGGTVTWNLGDLASGASGNVSVTVNLSSFGTYTNRSTATFMIGLTSKTAASNTTQTDYGNYTVPGAPSIGAATAGNAQATVSFTAPASNGGSAITSYTVTSNPGGLAATGSASPIIVTGLANGTAYNFTVTARNAIGAGAASAASNSVTPSAPPVVGLADFNADGHPDIIWSNTANGSTYLWYMNGPALISDAFIAGIDPSWKVQGVADFNGDGKPDLIWRNTANGNTYVWYMNGSTFVSDAFLFGLPPEWVIQGVADFNGDGKPDFLMRNTNTGVAFVWFFNNNVAIGDQFLFGIDPQWKVEAVADLNADGQPDLLFRNMASGLAFAWNTQYSAGNLSLAGSSPPIFGIDPVWEIVQMEDWNADGNPDLLFRNRNTGVVFVWYMTGTTLQGSAFITQIDPSWEIVPRR